ALAVAVDGVREPPAAPRGDLDDLTAIGGDLAGGAIDDRGDAVIRRFRTEDQHELVTAHGEERSFLWVCPGWINDRRSRKVKRESSTGTEPTRLYPLPSATPQTAPGSSVTDTRILLLGNAGSETLKKALGKPGRALTRIDDPDKLAAAAAAADIVVLDHVPPPRNVNDMCRELRGNEKLAEVPILAITSSDDVEERIKLLEAGADDVMIRPIDERELDARVEALDLRHRRSKELRPSTLVATTRRPGRRLMVV